MRVLIVDTYHGGFLRSHYAGRPGLDRQPWEEQHASLLDACFGTSDFYSRHLIEGGHEALETIANAGPLQRALARECRFRCGRVAALPGRAGLAALRRILVQHVKRMRPDVVYIQDADWVGGAAAREMWAHVRLLVAQHATTPPPATVLAPYDLVMSSLPNLVDQFRGNGLNAEYLPLAFEPRVLDRLPPATPRDVVHVGGYGRVHEERNALLEVVAEKVRVSCFGYGVESLPSSSAIRRSYEGEAWGLDMYGVRAASRITLTKHITAVAGAFANNATLFEATGVGTCLLVDERANLGELFVPGTEVATYADPDDCVLQIEELLRNDAKRTAIAAAGQRRTLGDHTWSRRIEDLSAILERRLRASRPRR